MVDECIKGNRIIGMVQPKKTGSLKKPNLYEVGCAGKITSFNETEDGRYLINLKGVIRFNFEKEEKTSEKFRKLKINFQKFEDDLISNFENRKNKVE